MIKRLFDICASFIGLVFLSPLFLLLAIAIKLDSKGPIFFRQTRMGLHGNHFRIYKFRSMVTKQQSDAPQITTSGDARITKVGRFIRHYKCDEFAQLINVLLGDMSLVGPRPEVPKYLAYYSPKQGVIVLSVRPGITDLASIQYANENDILAKADDSETCYTSVILPRKLRLCCYYVKHQSLCFDILIIFKTLKAIVR